MLSVVIAEDEASKNALVPNVYLKLKINYTPYLRV
jgi:hypothetical protein